MSNDLTIYMGGSVAWCDPRTMVGGVTVPSFGDLVFEIPELERTVIVSILNDPPGFLQVLVQSPDRRKTFTICDGNVTSTNLDCYAGPDIQ